MKINKTNKISWIGLDSQQSLLISSPTVAGKTELGLAILRLLVQVWNV